MKLGEIPNVILRVLYALLLIAFPFVLYGTGRVAYEIGIAYWASSRTPFLSLRTTLPYAPLLLIASLSATGSALLLCYRLWKGFMHVGPMLALTDWYLLQRKGTLER